MRNLLKFFVFLILSFCFINIAQSEQMTSANDEALNWQDVRIFLENNPTRSGSLADAAMFLSQEVKEPLWGSTKSPMGRDILYLLPHKITSIEYGGLAINLFFNMTNRMRVTGSEILRDDAINQEAIGPLFENFFGKDVENTNELSGLLPLFRKITIQERKAGGLIQVGFTRGPFAIQLHTSLQVAEKNFWLDQTDRDAISDVLKKYFGGAQISDKELYRIRFGMGDTRIKIGLNAVNRSNFQVDIGMETILPTSRFSYNSRAKPSVAQLITGAATPELRQKSGADLLRAIRDHLIDPQLGNNGYFGFGCYLESKVDLFNKFIQMWTRVSYDSLLPGEQDRLFMFRQTMSPEQLDPTGKTDDQIVKSLENFAQQYFFPSAFKVTVYPGGVFNFVYAISTDIKKFRFVVGYDFYSQQKEYIKKIHNTSVSLQDLRVEDTEHDSTGQHKIFSDIMYLSKGKKWDWGLGIGGDKTVKSTGIGEDWTVYLKFVASF